MSIEKIADNLDKIDKKIQASPDPGVFQTNDDFMAHAVELMNCALYLLRLGCSLAPSEKISEQGYIKRKAIIVGHMVRITKLYEGLLIHITKRQLELAAIFVRLEFESVVRMRYLMSAKNESFRNFVLSSYRPEKEILIDLKEKASNRPLIKIEKRIRRKIKSRLKKDRIPIRDLMKNKVWNLDQKDFRNLLQEIGWGDAYAYSFGSMSHPVHGDWYDISLHHIHRIGKYYLPDLDYDDPDPRISCPVTHICLEVLYDYLKWNKLDPDNHISSIILRLIEANRRVDMAHEEWMSD